MVSITSVDFFITTHFIISIACPMWASAKLFRFDLDNSFEFRAKYRFDADKLWRTSGLFIRRSQIRRLQKDRVLDDLFVLETSRVMFPFNGTCDMPVEIERGEAMPECDDDPRAPAPLNGSNWAGTTRGCCNTKMRVELPQTVKSVITGQSHQVLQFSYSSQLVHAGYCQNEGGMCVLGGRCAIVHRIQWLLVRAASIPASSSPDTHGPQNEGGDTSGHPDMFVPTMVANHCQCVFS